jgi:hypothetical protein
MLIPAVMFLEMALETLKGVRAEPATWPPLVDGGPNTTTLDREIKEFRMLGNRPDNLDGLGLSDRERGYLIGLTVVRVLLAQMPVNYQDGKPIVDL